MNVYAIPIPRVNAKVHLNIIVHANWSSIHNIVALRVVSMSVYVNPNRRMNVGVINKYIGNLKCISVVLV
jgi:hypothetical protein